MASADLARSGTSQLEEFVALNDELAALVRAGLPLELGLAANGRRLLAERITTRLRQGRSLDEALRDEGDRVPTAYRAVIEAGLRSGRLAEAVETVSRTARALVALQRRLAHASIYPAILVMLACLLALLIFPRMLATVVGIIVDDGDVPPAWLLGLHQTLREVPSYWLLAVPPAVVFVLWASGGLRALATRLPGLGLALRPYRIAAFAELTAGLIDHGTPLDEAIVLAADASGDRSIAGDARVVREQLRAGRPAAEALAALDSLPKFARWMITAGAAQGTLVATLRQVGDWAARRGAARADWFGLLAPAVVTVLVGGTAVVLFAAASFGPVIDLLYRLTEEMSM